MNAVTEQTRSLRDRLLEASRESLSASLGVCRTMLDGQLDPRAAKSYTRAMTAFELSACVALEAIDELEIVAATATATQEVVSV